MSFFDDFGAASPDENSAAAISPGRGVGRRALLLGVAGMAVLVASAAVWFARPQVDTTPAPTPTVTYSLTPQQAIAAPEPPPAVGAPKMSVAAMAPGSMWIPSLGAYGPLVDGTVVLEDGVRSLELPDDPSRMTVWAEGAAPAAQAGTTLVSGHVSYRGTPGTLRDLAYIEPGARIHVKDAAGKVTSWVNAAADVVEVEKTALPAWVWAGAAGPKRLVLVTCGGPLIPGTDRHRDNVIATAVPAPAGEA